MSSKTLQRNALAGLIASLLLALIKLVAGLVGHSTALIADALESMADSVGSVFVWKALRVASRPPDAEHPYGFGKAEAIAAFCVGGLLIVAALVIIVRSFHELVVPHEPPAPWTILVLLAVIAVKECLFRMMMRGAATFSSSAARADAWHHRADAITSVAALIGVSVAIIGVRWFGMPSLVAADEVAAILASGVILMTASNLIRPALSELLDASSPELSDDVQRISSSIPGVRLVEKILLRKSGAGYFLDMHLHVDPDQPIREAHALAGQVKAALRSGLPQLNGVLIHVEPDDRNNPTS